MRSRFRSRLPTDSPGYYGSSRGTYDDGGFDGSLNFGGTFDTDPESAGDHPWLSGALAGQVGMFAYGNTDGFRELYLEGSLQPADEAVTAISFTELFLRTGACVDEPGGLVSIREESGVWHDVTFDAIEDEDDEEAAERCDGCGERFVHGEADGNVCLSGGTTESWLSWEESPW